MEPCRNYSYSGHSRNNSVNLYNLLSVNMVGYNTNNNNMSAIMAGDSKMSSIDTMSVTNII